MVSAWGPPGSCRPQTGPMQAPWTLLSGVMSSLRYKSLRYTVYFGIGYRHMGLFLPTWINNHIHYKLWGWHYLSIPKLRRNNIWSWGMDKWFHLLLNCACDYLSMLGLKLNHVCKRDPMGCSGMDINDKLSVLVTPTGLLVLRPHCWPMDLLVNS